MSLVSKILGDEDYLIFSVEEIKDDINNKPYKYPRKRNADPDIGYKLQTSGRFAHSESYIRRLTKEFPDLRIVSLDRIVPRYENSVPLSGMLVLMGKRRKR